jgi:hypothetical protein
MTRDGYDVRAIYDDRGGVAGYVWQKRGRTGWGAILEGYCSCCAPEKRLGVFPKPLRRPRLSPASRRNRSNDRA